jgi:hypothetical protein
VDAVLDADPTPTRFVMNDGLEAPAHWLIDGRTHTGVIQVSATAGKGDHASIWVRPGGDQVPVPATRDEAVLDGVGAGFTLFCGTAVLAALLDWAVRRSVARRRARAWETEWAGLAGVRRWNRMW